jgi:hypothetical protein
MYGQGSNGASGQYGGSDGSDVSTGSGGCGGGGSGGTRGGLVFGSESHGDAFDTIGGGGGAHGGTENTPSGPAGTSFTESYGVLNAFGSGSQRGGSGGRGAVRILWGAGRSFPSTNVNEASSVTVTAVA